MARPLKEGLDYFPFDVDFFTDIKVRRLMKGSGPASSSILICLLCNIYQDKGYYIEWNKDLPFLIADTIGVSEGAVEEVIKKAVQVELFDVDIFEKHNVLTSSGIQSRFVEIIKRRKETEMFAEYLLIEIDKNVINVISNEVNVDNSPINEDRSTQSKVKESKVINNKEEIIVIYGKQKVISSTLYYSLQELLSDQIYLEAFAMNNQITLEQTEDFVKSFFVHLQNKNIHHKTKKDLIDHFANWIPFQLEKLTKKNQKKNDSNQRNSSTDTEGQARKQAIVSRLQQAAAKCDNKDT